MDAVTERGFQLDTGELVVCRIIRPPAQIGVVALIVATRMVDSAGKTLIIGGHEVAMPGHSVSVMIEHLAENPALLLPQVAAAMEREAQKVRGFAAALQSLSSFGPPTQV